MRKVSLIDEKEHISFYTKLPVKDLNIVKFKEYYEKREQLHRQLEQNKQITVSFTATEDKISHFVSRMVNSGDIEQASRFLKLETVYFKRRLENFTVQQINEFMKNEFLPHLQNFNGELIDFDTYFDPSAKRKTVRHTFFKIYFSKISECVGAASAIPLDGKVEMESSNVKPLLVSEFKSYLRAKMVDLSRTLGKSKTHRFQRIFRESREQKAERCAISEILQRLPPCIYGIVEKLEKNRHLKHRDRQTITLFLKDAGASVEETADYLRSKFDCTAERFNKEYLYHVRHGYGLVGKMAKYKAFSCSVMASMSSSPEAVGCAFSDYKKEKGALQKFCGKNEIEDIEDLLRRPNTEACSIMLEKISKKRVEINNPADFFKGMVGDKKSD